MEERRYFTDNPVRYEQAIGFIGVIYMGAAILLPWLPVEARIWAIASLVFLVPFCLRSLRLGVYSSQEGLRVCNTLRTHDINWREIEQITIDTTRWSGIAAIVECKDGRRIPCWGVQHPWMSTIERAYEGPCGTIVRQLNRDLERYHDNTADIDIGGEPPDTQTD